MKITRIHSPFPAAYIDDFIPSRALVRSAEESFNQVEDKDWVKYGVDEGQVQRCTKNRQCTTPASLAVLDYIASCFDPNSTFLNLTTSAFPDLSYYGGGMMVAPNSQGEGGYLGMHVDAETHKENSTWKREYSAVLCVSEINDPSFDLWLHDGKDKHTRIPYKFNRLNIFKCSDNSWHGFPEITKGLDRKTLGVMYWSKVDEGGKNLRVRAEFNNDLEFK